MLPTLGIVYSVLKPFFLLIGEQKVFLELQTAKCGGLTRWIYSNGVVPSLPCKEIGGELSKYSWFLIPLPEMIKKEADT